MKIKYSLAVAAIHQQGDKMTTSYDYVFFMQLSRRTKREQYMADYASQRIIMSRQVLYITDLFKRNLDSNYISPTAMREV